MSSIARSLPWLQSNNACEVHGPTPGVYCLLTLNCLPDISLFRPWDYRVLAQPQLQIAWWLWFQPDGSDEQTEPEVAGSLYGHPTQGTSSQWEGDTGRVLAPSGQGEAPGQGDGINWDCCPDNLSRNGSTHPPCSKVKGITIESLF